MPEGYIRRVGITKLHLEEDAGKTKNVGDVRYIDFNRCGVPLVEMVTAPDLRSADEAAQYLTRLRQLYAGWACRMQTWNGDTFVVMPMYPSVHRVWIT